MFDGRDLDMLRVWMLLVVGAAAMRQVAEDALAHSAVKEEWDPDLRKKVEEVAKKVAKENFNENERHYLKKAVMKAFKNGELDKGLKEMSGKEKQRYLLTTMQQMQDLRSLRSAAEEVAKKNFPKKEQHRLTEAVMNASEAVMNAWEKRRDWELKGRVSDLNKPPGRVSREKDLKGKFEKYLLETMQELQELPVAASAVKFCSNLFREANSEAWKSVMAEKVKAERLAEKARWAEIARWKAIGAEDRAKLGEARKEAENAAGICHKVLTGELGADDGPEWAEKAAKSSQPKDQHLKRGRLEKVNAVERAWKVSLDNVCKDECIELVKEMQKETEQILSDVQDVQDVTIGSHQRRPSYEEACAKRVVQKVEAEILGCCAESCGWNGIACMYWPFLSSTEKGQWEAECCTEFNILKNSSRATMCDATLTGKENKEVIRDPQPNNEEDREMIGQDPVLKGTSFLQREDTNGPSPPPENTPIPPYEGTCPDPLNLGKEHSKLKDEWKTTNFPLAQENFKYPGCGGTRPRNSTGNCTAFLPQGVDGKYVCYGHCLGSVDGLVFTNLTDTVPPSVNQLLYVHKSISGE